MLVGPWEPMDPPKTAIELPLPAHHPGGLGNGRALSLDPLGLCNQVWGGKRFPGKMEEPQKFWSVLIFFGGFKKNGYKVEVGFFGSFLKKDPLNF